MNEPSAGQVAFLFTDLEGSTRLWERRSDVMPAVYARHDAILRSAIMSQDGVVYKVIGDAFQVADDLVDGATVARDGGAENGIMPRVDLRHDVAPALPVAGAPFQVSEEEGDVSGPYMKSSASSVYAARASASRIRTRSPSRDRYPRASNRLSARLRVERVVPSSAASCP